MGPIGCIETSVSNYHHTLRNIPEEHLLRGGSLKSHIVLILTPCVGTRLISRLTLQRRHTCVCVPKRRLSQCLSLPIGRHSLRVKFVTTLMSNVCAVLTRENATGNKSYNSHAQDTITFQPSVHTRFEN